MKKLGFIGTGNMGGALIISAAKSKAENKLLLSDIITEKADALVNDIRMHKTENELKCMRAAAEITRKTFDYVLENIKVGMTEQQVCGLALGKMHELGAERESYPLWVLTGKGSNQAISRPRNKKIEKGISS